MGPWHLYYEIRKDQKGEKKVFVRTHIKAAGKTVCRWPAIWNKSTNMFVFCLIEFVDATFLTDAAPRGARV